MYTAYLLGKFGPKFQNCQFTLKFGSATNSNQLNSIIKFTFLVYNWKYLFWANLVQKNKSNCQFTLKIGTKANSNIQYSTMVFTFSVLDQNHSFWTNFV